MAHGSHGPMAPWAHGSKGPWSLVPSTKHQVLSTRDQVLSIRYPLSGPIRALYRALHRALFWALFSLRGLPYFALSWAQVRRAPIIGWFVLSFPFMPELKHMRLHLVDGRPDGDALRVFIISVAAARSSLVLPLENTEISWQAIGLHELPKEVKLVVANMHTLLKRMNFVMALPPAVFKKPGSFQTRLLVQALEQKTAKSKLTWAVFLVQHSTEFAMLSLENGAMRRCALAAALRTRDEPVWDTQFVWTNAAEYQRSPVEYTDTNSGLQGRTKADVQKSMGMIGPRGLH
jgi:hypothetical protein